MDPFRYCIYCDADCYENEPAHTGGCPSSTGIFPIESLHVPDGDESDAACMDCDQPFRRGDSYTHRWAEPIDGTPCGEVICLGCAAEAELLGTPTA